MLTFDHSDEHQKVSIDSVEKETKANKKKASKRDIIVVDDNSYWPGTVRESQRTLKKNTRAKRMRMRKVSIFKIAFANANFTTRTPLS